MDYQDKVVITQRQKERLSFQLDKDLIENTKENLQMIGLDQSNFLTGFITNIANNESLPFTALSDEEEKKAQLSAKLNQLTGKFEDVPELKNKDEFNKWMEEDDE